MTEYWKSNPMYWCDVCHVWLQDNSTAKANHERGRRHQENLAKKLREMRQKGDAMKSEVKSVKASLKQIEAAAKKQYESDLKVMGGASVPGQAAKSDPGAWILDSASGYYYNEMQRYYYDKLSKWYYGGDPPQWIQDPKIPDAAKFAATGSSKEKGNSGATLGAAGVKYDVKTIKVAVPHHPLAGIGGHQMPTSGKIGGLKRLGAEGGKDEAPGSPSGKPKKKLKPSDDPNVPAEEREALKKREAARARVKQRTMATFGLG